MGCDWYKQRFLLIKYKDKYGEIREACRGMIDDAVYEMEPNYDSDNEEFDWVGYIESKIDTYKKQNPSKILYENGKWLILSKSKIETTKLLLNEGIYSHYPCLSQSCINTGDDIDISNIISMTRLYDGRVRY